MSNDQQQQQSPLPPPPPPPPLVTPTLVASLPNRNAPISKSISPTSMQTSALSPPPPPSKQEEQSSPIVTTTGTSNASTSDNRNAHHDSIEKEVDIFLSSPPNYDTLLLLTSDPNNDHHDNNNNNKDSNFLPLLNPKPLKYINDNDNKVYLLLELVSRRAWNDVVQLSDELLFNKDSIYQPFCSYLINYKKNDNDSSLTDDSIVGKKEESLQKDVIHILQWRIRSMLHLHRFHDMKKCIEKMNLTYTKYCNNDIPSWVPLKIILHAMECMVSYNAYEHERNKQTINKSEEEEAMTTVKSDDETLDEFYTLRNKVLHQDDTNKRTDKWIDVLEIDIIMSNILTQKSQWRLALVTLDGIIGYSNDVASCLAKKICSDQDSTGVIQSGLLQNTTFIIRKAISIETYSRQGRILLQAGALPAAATIFERAHDEYQELEQSNIVAKVIGIDDDSFKLVNLPTKGHILCGQNISMNIPTQILINEGLLHFAHQDYDLAEIKFSKAIQLQLNLREGQSDVDFLRGQLIDTMMDTEGDLLIPCLNNFALCTLYTCRMRDAVAIMESLIKQDPTNYLNHCIVFNLCTLYELGWDNATSDTKKRVLQSIATRFSLHDIRSESFRLS